MKYTVLTFEKTGKPCAMDFALRETALKYCLQHLKKGALSADLFKNSVFKKTFTINDINGEGVLE